MFFYSVVYEEENFLVINKTSGLLVHKNKYESDNNLIDLINKNKNQKFFLINRIDKDTSGLLLVAKSKEAVIKFQELFKNKEIQKDYLAIITNTLPAKEVKINLSLGKSKNNKLMFSSWNATQYKQSITYAYKLEKNLIKLTIYTGRTHQIRAHLFSIKCPILNDPIYGKKIDNNNFGQYLHSYSLSFINPFNMQKICITTPPPVEFLNKLNELKIHYNLPKSNVIEIDDQIVEWVNPYINSFENTTNNNLDINNFVGNLDIKNESIDKQREISNEKLHQEIQDYLDSENIEELQQNEYLESLMNNQDSSYSEETNNLDPVSTMSVTEEENTIFDTVEETILDNPIINDEANSTDFDNVEENIFDSATAKEVEVIDAEKVEENS